MKKFVNQRNKILLSSAIISALFIVICYYLVIRDMGYIKLFFPTVERDLAIGNSALLTCKPVVYLSFYSILSNILILLMSLFNLVGYVTKKIELNIISIGIGLFASIILLFYITPIANALLFLNILLIILGIVDSLINKK